MEGGRDRASVVGTAVLATLGLLLLSVPLYDVYDDVVNQGNVAAWTFVENTVPALLAVSLVGGAVWLQVSDWEDPYVDTAIGWCAAGVAGALLMHAWVLGIQAWVQNHLKPVVIAADTVLAAGVAGLAVGVYRAQSARRRDDLEHERDRLSALFENTTDAIAVVAYHGSRPEVVEVNDTFEETFGFDEADLRGEDLSTHLVPEGEDVQVEPEDVRARATAGESFETEVRRVAADGVRDFLLRIVPLDDGDRLYAVYTDITDRKRLHEERAARNRVEYLHGVAAQMTRAESVPELDDIAMDAADDVFDFDRGWLVLDADVVAGSDADVHDRGRVEDAVGRGTRIDHREDCVVLTAPVGDAGALQLVSESGGLDEWDRDAADLLTTHLSQTRERLQHERELAEERQRLEFLNRVLRHNLLNGMNVVEARLHLLGDHVDESARGHYDTIADRVDDMIGLIETMRSFMKAIVENEEHELETVDVDDVVTAEVERARAAAPDATFEVADLPGVAVLADDLLAEVFENLLTNAVQHNDTGDPRVRVSGTATDDRVRVVVADDGPGVPDDEQREVFEKGMKGLQSPGTGFGLYLVKEIVENYGGRVDVRDADLGGAAFVVELPRA